jgi:membrane associated rhomboid family serine protease
MKKSGKKSLLPYIPGYDNNAILKLVFFISGAYITLAISWAVGMIVNLSADKFNEFFLPNLGLPHLAQFPQKWWTIFTYGILHFPNSFMEMLSNMLWLYMFGSVLQMLVGKKHIAAVFFYSILMGGVFYLLAQLLPGDLGNCPPLILGPRAGIMGMCAATITISPKYRFYLSDTFSVPIMAVVGVFGVLTIIGTGYWVPMIAMVVGGGLMGFAYIKLLQAGCNPSQWIYSIYGMMERSVTPGQNIKNKGNRIKFEPSHNNTQQRVDELLDKINQKGYKSLSKEERDFLTNAGK